uniref:Uncharacterized protein n=1 Tax=Pyrodinium bahamense TaxID=73915 RepID=A0A7S0AI06_9DINO
MFLLRRNSDHAILMSGGAVTTQSDGQVLQRVCRNGRILRYRRLTLPSTTAVSQFQGHWVHCDGPLPEAWLSTMTLRGRVWTGSDAEFSGLLFLDDGAQSVCLGSMCLSVSANASNERFLWMSTTATEEPCRWCYRYSHAVGDPWVYS